MTDESPSRLITRPASITRGKLLTRRTRFFLLPLRRPTHKSCLSGLVTDESNLATLLDPLIAYENSS